MVVANGTSARGVIRTLARGGVLSDEALAWRYVRWVKRDPRPFQAGEYAFTGPLLPDDVLERVYHGEVKTATLHRPRGAARRRDRADRREERPRHRRGASSA